MDGLNPVSLIIIVLYLMGISIVFCDEYQIGVGIADCTGPAAGITFMGYAKAKQKGCGIHLRQFSRAFIIDDGQNRVAFISVDACMMAIGVKRAVINRLNAIYNSTYNEENVIMSGTHTHSTPGGFLMDLMYDIPNGGFVQETFDALVNGITKSIIRAHRNMVNGKVYLSSGEVFDANINRSPTAYLLNPPEERANYEYDVDKELVQLKFVRLSDNDVIGAINWFAVHPTSMNNTNCLVTSDNVGYASILLEKMMNKNTLLGKGPFIGAFASTNLGDVSPNTKGPHCINTGATCDMDHSTCDGQSQQCIASGPGRDMFESTRIIAEKIFNKAKELLEQSNNHEITGPIKFIHQYVDMPTQKATIIFQNNTEQEIKGCLPSMGYSFAAGTTDGPGEFDFQQATKVTNPFWNTIRDFIFPPTEADIDCQYPKPILVNTGRISKPYQWQTRIVSTQLIQLGNVILIAVPGEFTTMAGRRLRDTVKQTVINNDGPNNVKPIITGLSNMYTSYITTPEEYQMQRYEGASTIYGPHTLTIYLKIYRDLTEALFKNHQLDPGPQPPDFSTKLLSLTPPVLFDTAGLLENFGNCILQPPTTVQLGDLVVVKFTAGHPRNNVMQDKSFLYVERFFGDRWTVYTTDADWNTKFIWGRTSFLIGGSTATIEWNIPHDTPIGLYRIRHSGYYKYIFGGIFPYEGITNSFKVI